MPNTFKPGDKAKTIDKIWSRVAYIERDTEVKIEWVTGNTVGICGPGFSGPYKFPYDNIRIEGIDYRQLEKISAPDEQYKYMG